ncbi:hypothetical protein [Alienimonas sp. DA493]|uniref:hypothetical protein n=1 Tax=Alienimonas sp. DA493 TaxID=3373605 RepID=UPI0037543A62
MYSHNTPGFSTARTTQEASVLWGNPEAHQHVIVGAVVDSTARDSGATPTTALRAGLVLAKLDSATDGDGDEEVRYVDYDPDATDGSQNPAGVLLDGVDVLDVDTGEAADQQWRMVIAGPVKASHCIGLDDHARSVLARNGVIWDDGYAGGAFYPTGDVAKTSDYTVTTAENGTRFTNNGAAGAVVFTLPAIANGLTYGFLVLADQNVTVVSAEGDNIVVQGDAAADSVAFSTASEKVGGQVKLEARYVGATLKWLVTEMSGNTLTVAT